MKFACALLLITLVGYTQALECTVGYDEPDAQGHLTGTPIIAYLPCQTKCITIFVKTAQHPTGTIAASCATDNTATCDGSFVLDVNTWTEVKCCSTDRCNGPTGNFPWDGYDWRTPRNPMIPTSSTTTDAPTTTTDAPTSTSTTTSAPTGTSTTTDSPTSAGPTTSATAAPGSILCTVGTSVPDGSGGVRQTVTTQSCTQCYSIYTHSSLGAQNVGVISGGCADSNNRQCDFQGTVVTQQGQWVEVKCCSSGNQCNSQDWAAGQYDWTTPRTSSASTRQPTTSTNSTMAPTNTPTSQPITGNNTNTISSTGVHHSSATTVVMSHVCLFGCMMMVLMSMMM